MISRKQLLVALAFTVFGTGVQAADEVVVYSSRIDELIKPVFDAYTAETGVKIKFITDKEAPLMQRIKAEGENATADLLLTVDAGNVASRADGHLAADQVRRDRRQYSTAIPCLLS